MRAAKIIADRSGLRANSLLNPDQIPATSSKLLGSLWRPVPAVFWGGLGFFSGAIFWHAVGFWAFISDVVLKSAPEVSVEVARAQVPVALAADTAKRTVPTILLVDAANCTALALDRKSNLTQLHPCPAEGLALRLEQDYAREDLESPSETQLQAAGYQAN